MAGKDKTVYDNYEISGCLRIDGAGRPNRGGKFIEPSDDREAHFWTLYGHIHGQGVEAIGDFDSREAAEEVFYRITGVSYTGANAADRLRLMHAAPLLLEALEPYAVEAINLAQSANGEDNEDVIDHIASKSVNAYTEATPRPPGADAVTRQIERLLDAGYLEDWDDPNKVWPDFAGLNASHIAQTMLAWAGLDRSQQERMLDKYVLWNGFDHPSKDRVMGNVLDRRPKEEWFSGGRNVTPSESHALTSSGDKPRQLWPSEIARDNRQHGRDQGTSSGDEKANGKDTGHSM